MSRRVVARVGLRVALAIMTIAMVATPLLDAAPALAGPKDKKPPEPSPKKAPEPKKPPEPDKPPATPVKSESPGSRRVIGVLDVRVEGVPAEIAAQFQTGLEVQLDSRRYWLSGRAKMKERMTSSTKWTDGCLVGLCLSDVKTQTGAELVLLAALSGSGTSFGYVVTLVRTDTGQVVAQQSDRCDVCTLNEVMGNATLATIELINAVPDTLPSAVDHTAAITTAAAIPYQKQIDALGAKQRRKTHLGIGLTVAGVVIAGAGMALYFTQDKPAYAIATAAVGGGAALGGVTVLAF